MADPWAVSLGDIRRELERLPVFTDCAPCFDKLADTTLHVLTYAFGEKVIVALDQDGSPLPGEEALRLPTGKGGESGDPAAPRLQPPLDGNPLFVVLKGFAEIHNSVVGGTGGRGVLPATIVNAGDLFGEFEISGICAPSWSAKWNSYVADVTAGIATVLVSARTFNNSDVQQAIGYFAERERDLANPAHVAQVLYDTMQDWQLPFELKLLVLPPTAVSTLCTHAPFLRRYHDIWESHVRTYQLLNPVGREKTFKRDQMYRHFAKCLVPAMLDGEIPILASCVEYHELKEWWCAYHARLKKNNIHNLSRLHLPHYFFVPVSGATAKKVVAQAVDGTGFAPVLSGPMIQGLVRGIGVYRGALNHKFVQGVEHALDVTNTPWRLAKLDDAYLLEHRRKDWSAHFGLGSVPSTAKSSIPGTLNLLRPVGKRD